MKVLFISSGNAKDGISPIIKNQGESLINEGVDVQFFTIKGKGFLSYLKHIRILYKHLYENKYDLHHAHYSLSAFVATLAGCRPLVVSLMGSEMNSGLIIKIMIRLFANLRWDAVIVKSLSMSRRLKISKAKIIPNGVDLNVVKPSVSQSDDPSHKTVLFASDPANYVKNYPLAEKAVSMVENYQVKLKIIHSMSHKEVIKAINNADVLLLTSLWEGSPNIVKEAMACNCPVVATNVGDIEWLFENEPGHFTSGFEPEDVAEKLTLALKFSETYKRTNGRKRITELGLDSVTIAKKLISVYKSVTPVNE